MTAEHRRRGRDRAPWRQAAGGAALLAVLALALTRPSTAAQPNQLSNPGVSPRGGTIGTIFSFSVRYESSQGNEPTSVTAVVGNVVIPLALASGSPANGRYRGSAQLPPGTWTVLFRATAKGNDPSLDGPNVTIRPPPTPTPRPTPQPTPRPTPRPTTAASQAPLPSSAPQTTEPRTPRPTRSPSSSERPRTQSPSPGETQQPPAAGSGTPQPTEGAVVGGTGTDAEQQLVTIITGGLIAIGALTLIGILALLRDRRRRATEERLLLLPDSAREGAASPPRPRPQRAPTTWERDFALDEEPIGTVEYRPPPPADEEGS